MSLSASLQNQPANQSLIYDLHELLAHAQRVTLELERGQIETPLTDRFQKIEQMFERNTFTLTLLGLTPESMWSVLSWIYGKAFANLMVDAPQQLRLLEIELREQGYVLEDLSQGSVKFDNLESLFDAIQRPVTVSENDTNNDINNIELVRLGVETEHDIKNLRIFLVENSELLIKTPSLLNKVITQSNLLVLAAPLEHSLAEADKKAILEISSQMDAVWPLLTVDELIDDISNVEHGWWESACNTNTQIIPLLLTTHVEAFMPSLMTDSQSEMRTALLLKRAVREIAAAVDVLHDHQKHEIHQHDLREQHENRKISAIDETSEWDVLKKSVLDEFTNIYTGIQVQNERVMSPTSDLAIQISSLLDTLRIVDLKNTKGRKSIEQKEHKDHIIELTEKIKLLLKSQLRVDLQLTKKVCVAVHAKLKKKISNLSPVPFNQTIAFPNVDDHWASIEKTFDEELGYVCEGAQPVLMNIINNIQRIKLNKFKIHLDKIKKNISTTIDEISQESKISKTGDKTQSCQKDKQALNSSGLSKLSIDKLGNDVQQLLSDLEILTNASSDYLRNSIDN